DIKKEIDKSQDIELGANENFENIIKSLVDLYGIEKLKDKIVEPIKEQKLAHGLEQTAKNLQESVQKKTSGWPLAGVWNFFNKGSSIKGYCLGTCKECGSFWAHAKSVDLEEHLALDCPTQNKDVIDFYTQIIANQQSHSQAASQKNILGAEPNKKKHKLTSNQATLSEFLESTKLTPQRE
ncbi:27681_t:CDS:2, partial [Dentiscutata erythropus]